MATCPLIFPSLSRQPSMDSSRSIEDDTIRDQAENGCVSTRPRFTRARRTWKANVRNLEAEDVRALDEFAMVTAARGGNAFLFPNLLPNGSFEFPAVCAADVAAGWMLSADASQEAVTISTVTIQDGTQALAFSTMPGESIPATSAVTGQVSADQYVPCLGGEVYVFRAAVNAALGALASGVLSGAASVTFSDVNGETLSTQSAAVTIGGGWRTLSLQFTVPAAAVSFAVTLAMTLTNTTGAPIALDGSSSITWDALGCALLTPLTPYGRMAGSHSLGCMVRFGKLPEVSDIGFGQGIKRYGATLELAEV